MKICPNCKKEFLDEINFCGSCGVKLVLKQRPKFCGNCGARVNDESPVRNNPPVSTPPKSFLKEFKTRLTLVRNDIKGDPNLRETVENIDKIFADIDSPLTVVVAGARSTEKSAFINALVSLKPISIIDGADLNVDNQDLKPIVIDNPINALARKEAVKKIRNVISNAEKYKATRVIEALSINLDCLASTSAVGHLTELITYVQTFCFNPKLLDEKIANLFLGVRYMFDAIPGNDIDKAKIYLEKSAAKGNAVAQTFLTLLLIRKEKFAEVKRWAESVNNCHFASKYLQQQQAFIQYQLGTMYYEGKGTAVDKARAAILLNKSVEGGCKKGKTALGLLMLKSDDASYNPQKGLRLLEEAADEGDRSAPLILYFTYKSGEFGVAENVTEACRWAEKIAGDDNLLNAMSEDQRYTLFSYLGFKYYFGDGVEQDYAKADRYLVKAAAGGNDSAQYVLGCNYLEGYGCVQNREKGMYWIKQSAAQGNEYAIQKLQEIEQAAPRPSAQSGTNIGDKIDTVNDIANAASDIFKSPSPQPEPEPEPEPDTPPPDVEDVVDEDPDDNVLDFLKNWFG